MPRSRSGKSERTGRSRLFAGLPELLRKELRAFVRVSMANDLSPGARVDGDVEACIEQMVLELQRTGQLDSLIAETHRINALTAEELASHKSTKRSAPGMQLVYDRGGRPGVKPSKSS